MQQVTSAIRSQEVYRLSNLGIDPKSFKFGVLSFESDKYISVKDTSTTGESQLTIIELENNFNFSRKPNKAEAALMHPTKNILALKAKTEQGNGSIVQVYNLDNKQKLKHVEFPDIIVYWHWVSQIKLACVTPTAVYHVNIENQEPQTKIMDRANALADSVNVQIIGYNLDPQEKWCALYGISTTDGKTINGHIQLFSIDLQKQQPLDGHCCTFGEVLIHNDEQKSVLFCFAERKPGENTSRIHFNEISVIQGFQKFKVNTEIQYDANTPGDFPVVMHISTKYGLLYVVTKFSYLYVYEITTASLIHRTRISQDTVFIGAKSSKNDGLFVVTKQGALILNSLDESQYVPYIINNCTHIPDNMNLALKLANRYKLEGAGQMFLESFNRSIINGDFAGAAKIVASSPGVSLRNQETINKFRQIPGNPPPLLIYFQTLLERGKLNKIESCELIAIILPQNKKHLIEPWLQQDKIECSEELGDLVKKFDIQIAMTIYQKGGVQQKYLTCLMETGQVELALKYSQQVGIQTDYITIIRNLVVTNPESALNTAKQVCLKDPSINVHAIAEIFEQKGRIQEMTAFLVDCMKRNVPEDGQWQTKVLESNIMLGHFQVVDAIFQMDIWNQYNRQQIAARCEQKGFFQRALENFTDIKDIRRVVLNTQSLNPEWLVAYLGKIQADWAIICLQELLRHNRQNIQIVTNAAIQHHAKLGVPNCIKVFESASIFDGLYFFLGSIINTSNDKEIYFKYIEAAAKGNQLKEIERVIRDKPECYDPVKVKDFLKEMKLADPRPLIFLCDMHGFIDELTKYLYKNNFSKFIETYLLKFNANASPQVLGNLIDLEAEENWIQQILYNLRGNCPIEPLIEEFEKRNKLRVLERWLLSREAEGNQMPALHNAIAKIKIDTNQDPESFLLNNQYYNSKIVGKFCEERDPHFAVIAYKRAWGECDKELIECTNKYNLFRLQARYLVERQSPELWAECLNPNNTNRKLLVEQVVSVALPESKNVEEVAKTVEAFLSADMPLELLALLEKIVLHNQEFGTYKYLQNLLLVTAMRAEKSKVMDYVKRLDQYEIKVAKEAIQHGLFEEAHYIYKKKNSNVEALDILLVQLNNIQRAAEFAQAINQTDVWSKLSQAYLEKQLVVEAIDCLLKANDATDYSRVIFLAESQEKWEILIKYLLMVRQQIKDQTIDNSLAYCYGKLDKLAELEQFINNPNSVDNQRVGDRCFDDKKYEAAKILFTSIKNNAKIASCLVRLKQFTQAIEAAKKANTPKTWKELCMACIAASEFKIAQTAGAYIIIHPDHLEELITYFEEYGVPDEMINLLEYGVTLDRAHVGIFTELGILYAKYKPEKLMEHCKNYFQKINVPKLLRSCKTYQHWQETVYLYSHYDEFDNAINIIIEHSPSAWSHDQFVQLIQKVSNHDLHYKAIHFYLEEQPMMLNELLKSLSSKIDLSKCVSLMKKTGYIGLIQPFLKTAQSSNNKEVNEALNELYLEQEDYEALRTSITTYENFDQQYLARSTEKHELIEFRRIAAYLYRKFGKYDQSIALSKQDEMYRVIIVNVKQKDAVETAQESGKPELVEELLRFFVSKSEKEFFTVCLYTCYDLIRPDVIMELAWRFGLMEFAMPYFIQITRELTSKVEHVQKKHEDREKKEEKQAQQQMNQPLDIVQDMGFMMTGYNQFNQPMLMPPNMPNMMQQGGGFNNSQFQPQQFQGGNFQPYGM